MRATNTAGPKEAIILAGGFGTRLRGTIGDLPKCMAPVAGMPFLHYLFRYLEGQMVTRVVLSLGYKSEAIIEWLDSERPTFRVDCVVEQEALGTGGGIRLAMEQSTASDVFILNGDTLFMVDLMQMLTLHQQSPAETTLAIKAMTDFDRYGTVRMTADGVITSFEEKAPKVHGDINGGVYVINREAFMQRSFPQKFSFEKDYLEHHVSEAVFYGLSSDAYFIDIGVPRDYEQAQLDFQILFPA